MENQHDFDVNIEQMLQKSIQQNYVQSGKGYDVSDERLKEMNKKLPAWNLEPPFSSLK